MKPELKSQILLGVTRSKAKMIEYSIPEEHHIAITQDPAKLFTLSISLLGDLAASISRNETESNYFKELKNNLLFSARFFDSYFQTNLNGELDTYLVLLGSASYYLCDLPGSSLVLSKRINGIFQDLECDGLEYLLLWLLQSDTNLLINKLDSPFTDLINLISMNVINFVDKGEGDENLLSLAMKLRSKAYEIGTPRQLLFGDLISSIIKKKIDNSTWKALPLYSGLPRSKWQQVLEKNSFIKELWPAQHLMGKSNVLKGKSAIVQMPTSAGKTKATELILRSAFLAERVSLAIIIAPFRALCCEIKNSLIDAFRNEPTNVDELSDALQTDFDISEFLGCQQILVVTPEKLIYVLRHNPELAIHVGLLVFDEGHQFDNGIRGITYELLLTSLRSMIPEKTQKVLISAVINNAESVGEWLNGESNVVEGTTLIPTYRSVAFTSWLDSLGRIEYVNSRDIEVKDFFVPRVIERFNLGKKKNERIDRFFPEKGDSQAIALYLGLKLTPNGSIAVFCGKKSSAASICDKAVKAFERNVPLPLPSDFSNKHELERLTYLHVKNLGSDASASKSASYGIFSHHRNTPHGIRLAVEHAMHLGLVRFIVCTSTLAQGVNLPIRYLIITNVYQGMERIKVRDFHNLIGRAGRAGMHTEGSIIFADPAIYDKRKVFTDKWRWEQVKELLDPRNSEPCISNLLSIFDPIKSDDEKFIINMKALDFAKAYINNPEGITNIATTIASNHKNRNFSKSGVERQVSWRMNLICAVESFLLSHWDEAEDGLSETDVTRLSEETLAFFLADNEKKDYIRELFQLLAKNISTNITNSSRRKSYGKTLYGIQDSQDIEVWVKTNTNSLLSITDDTEILELVWPLFLRHIKGGVFGNFNKPDTLIEITKDWINGKPFSDLLELIYNVKAKMKQGKRLVNFKIDHVVDICEGKLAYDGTLILSAISEFIELHINKGTEELLYRIQFFQKRLKYGLPSLTSIYLYEIGFSDRVIAQELAHLIEYSAQDKREVIKLLKSNRDKALILIQKYPKYYHKVLSNIVH